MKTIAISTSSFGKIDEKPLKILKSSGVSPLLNPSGRKLSKSELVDLAKGSIGLIAGTEILDEDVFCQLPELRVISRCGVGMDNVDQVAAKAYSIEVHNTPDAPTLAAAELTVGLILSLLRHTARMDRDLRAGKWKKRMGSLLSGKKIGIIGFGRIGQKIAKLLLPFGVEISYCDICKISCTLLCESKQLQDILPWADIVTLHCSKTPDGKFLIGVKELQLMKASSFLINVSRGSVIDESALYDSLSQGRIAGAALDVYQDEPYKGSLLEIENIILTPHIGSYAKEARVQMEIQAVENLLQGLKKIGEL